jgi:hypothetical protein
MSRLNHEISKSLLNELNLKDPAIKTRTIGLKARTPKNETSKGVPGVPHVIVNLMAG